MLLEGAAHKVLLARKQKHSQGCQARQVRREEGRKHLAAELTRTGARPEMLSLPLEHAGSAALAPIPSSAALLDTGNSCLSSPEGLAKRSTGPSAALPRRGLSPCAAAPSKRPGAGEPIAYSSTL